MPRSCTVSGSVTMPWQPTVTPAAPLAHASSPSSYPPSCLVISRPTLLGVFAQMRGVGIPASYSQSHLHSHHSLDSVTEMVATDASATVSNVVGMIGTEAGLSVQISARKVQWCVSPINVLQIGCQLFPTLSFC